MRPRMLAMLCSGSRKYFHLVACRLGAENRASRSLLFQFARRPASQSERNTTGIIIIIIVVVVVVVAVLMILAFCLLAFLVI